MRNVLIVFGATLLEAAVVIVAINAGMWLEGGKYWSGMASSTRTVLILICGSFLFTSLLHSAVTATVWWNRQGLFDRIAITAIIYVIFLLSVAGFYLVPALLGGSMVAAFAILLMVLVAFGDLRQRRVFSRTIEET